MWPLASFSFPGVRASKSLPVSTGRQLGFCDALSEPVDFGVVDPRDLIEGRVFGEVVENFQRGDDRVDVIVFLTPDARADEIEAVRAAADSIPLVTVVSVADQSQHYDEFRAVFADDPQILAAAGRSDMPSSVRLELGDMDPEALQAMPAEVEDRLGALGAVWQIAASPEVTLAPVRLRDVSLADLLLEVPLRPQLEVYLNPSATVAEFEAVEASIAGTGARYVTFDRAEAFAEFQALNPANAEYDVGDMTPSIRAEQADGLFEAADALPFGSTFDVVGRRGSEPVVRDVERQVLAALLAGPAAESMLAAAREAEPSLADALRDLSEVPGPGDGDLYEAASALRDRLATECGQQINVGDKRRPLYDLMDRLYELGGAID